MIEGLEVARLEFVMLIITHITRTVNDALYLKLSYVGKPSWLQITFDTSSQT